MNILNTLHWLNNDILALPSTLLFLGAGIILSLKTRFVQIRAFPRFVGLITGVIKAQDAEKSEGQTINRFHALFAAMATTIGMGSIVGPSIAIIAGGPGALFWLVVYIFFGSVTKFTEVAFAIHTREKMPDGYVVGGPMQYLKSVSKFLALWYGVIMVVLFASWSSAQSNTLASILAQESVPEWMVGLGLAIIVLVVLSGGAQRVGSIASKLVPLMFVTYITFAIVILSRDLSALSHAIHLIFQSVFSPAAAMGAFMGASITQAMRAGTYKAIFITEAGLGTSSIPHAVADTKNPVDQGILAMGSTVAEMILSVISGLIILVTGVWQVGAFRSTLIYEAFGAYVPGIGQYALIASLGLFILTTVIGNSFNGVQSFSSLTNHRFVKIYIGFTVIIIFLGSLMPVPLVWEIMDSLFAFVAIPNLIGLLILAFRQSNVIRY